MARYVFFVFIRLLQSPFRHSHSVVFGLYSATPISPHVVCFLVFVSGSVSSSSVSSSCAHGPGWHFSFSADSLPRCIIIFDCSSFSSVAASLYLPSSVPLLLPGLILFHLVFAAVSRGGLLIFSHRLYSLRLSVQLFVPCRRSVVGFLWFLSSSLFSFYFIDHLSE